MSGLAALVANYTDSEDEDQNGDIDDLDEHNTHDSMTFTSNPPSNPAVASNVTPNSGTNSQRSTPSGRKPLKLVSYGEIQDDNDDKDVEPVPMEVESDEESKDEAGNNKGGASAAENIILNRSNSVIVDAWSVGGSLPPEPQGLCSPKIQESVNRAMQKKLRYNFDMNLDIQGMKSFRNPSIYEKLIQFCEIDETGTNLPKELYDGHLFGKESYYDELAKVQKIDMEKREKAAKERNATIERSKDELLAKVAATKRKSKWDQGPGAQAPVAKTIPAFGALKK